MTELASGIAQKILEKLGSLVHEELRLVLVIKSELTELEGTVTTIKAVLLDAEEKQASNLALSIWLRQLKDILYDAEDVLDEVECQVLRKQVVSTYGSTSRKVCDFFACFPALAFRSQLGHKIKNIRERLGKIAAEKDKFHLVERVEDRYVMHRRRATTHSYVPPSNVIGRENDQKYITDLLMKHDANRDNASVISIVGLGGIGKTTLAKLAYNDKCVAEHFESRMWVYVSEDFDITKLIREIIAELGVRTDEKSSTLNELQTNLRENLKNKRFLLVLDDVWNEDRNKWMELRDLLLGCSEGSKILVTTRSNKVASIMGTVSTHNLKGLSEKDSLSLFRKHAFREGEDNKYPNLLEIGKEIVEKCKGVPLAIRTLGSLLFSKVVEREWKLVRDNEIWKLEQKEDDILPALKLSYDQMSSHLKQCFAFCSLFPKDYVYDSGELIAFWMAHGLLNKTLVTQELEDVGDVYFKELWSRSFFVDVENELWYYRYRFKMHDLVHDLALKVAEEECSIVNSYTQNVARTARHLSFLQDGQQVPSYFSKLSSGMRTTLFPTEQQVSTLVEACISRFKSLRVLDLSLSSFEVLSSSIDTLKHLRYLSLAWNGSIKTLPRSICNLYNLQTLLLHGCVRLERLPKDTTKMISLRYLTVTTTYIHLFENDVCFLNSLRFLAISGCPRLESLFQGASMDGSLTNLRTLVVTDCEKLTSLTYDIKYLTALETLAIEGCKELSLMGAEDNWNAKLSLKKLKICNLPKLEVLPPWLQRYANTLQCLHISTCKNLAALPEWLPSLKSLHTLEIFGCFNLSSLPERMGLLTELRELNIGDCPELIRKCKEEDLSKIAHIQTIQLLDHNSPEMK
jgi:Leucine-rich repeat (LRR) protein